MNNPDVKNVVLGNKNFQVLKLEPWKRLMFLADLQKDFLTPALKEMGASDVKSLVGDSETNIDAMALISSFSQVIDGQSIEKWAKRIASEGMLIQVREDNQRVRIAFAEFSKVFESPADILNIFKEAILFNLGDVNELMKTVQNQVGNKPKS